MTKKDDIYFGLQYWGVGEGWGEWETAEENKPKQNGQVLSADMDSCDMALLCSCHDS